MAHATELVNNIQEDLMPTFMMSLNWTDQGIRAVKDSPKRSEAARELAKKVGVEIKHLYLTSGDSDLVIFVDAPSGDNVAKFALVRLYSRPGKDLTARFPLIVETLSRLRSPSRRSCRL
jgi:uncharacterized protein with GYD domain